MKIGIDLRSLEGGAQHRGIGRYATKLIEAMGMLDAKNEFVFFLSDKHAEAPVFKLSKSFKSSIIHGKQAVLRKLKYIRIVYIAPKALLIDKYKLDVFFHIDTSQPIRFKKTPVVSVVYDLIPYLYKEYYRTLKLARYTPGYIIGHSRVKLRWRLEEKWLQQYKRSAHIISISEHTKKDLLKFVPGLDPKNITSIPLASDQLLDTKTTMPESFKNLRKKRFLFYVGGADPRKGLVALAESFEKVWLSNPDVMLVLAGKEVTSSEVPEARRLEKTVARLSRPDQIILHGFISDLELAWLYKNATAFVFPSRYEGFGLPILEAMQAGCPVITYGNSSIPEVAGKAALLVPDGRSMVDSIRKVLENEKFRHELIAKGKKQAAKFTWLKTAEETLRILEEVGRTK